MLLTLLVSCAGHGLPGSPSLPTSPSASEAPAQCVSELEAQEYRRALPACKEALQHVQRQLGPNHIEVTVWLERVGRCLMHARAAEQLEQAEQLLLQAIAINEARHGHEHAAIMQPLMTLGDLYRKLELERKGELALRRAQRLADAVKAPVTEVASINLGLARVYVEAGRTTKAVDLLWSNQQLLEKHNVGGTLLADNIGLIAWIRREQSNYADAISLYNKALSIRDSIQPAVRDDKLKLAETLRKLANLYGFQKVKMDYKADYADFKAKYATQEKLFLRALSIMESNTDSNDPILVRILSDVSEFYLGFDSVVISSLSSESDAEIRSNKGAEYLRRTLKIMEENSEYFRPIEIIYHYETLIKKHEELKQWPIAASLLEHLQSYRSKNAELMEPEWKHFQRFGTIFANMGMKAKADNYFGRAFASALYHHKATKLDLEKLIKAIAESRGDNSDDYLRWIYENKSFSSEFLNSSLTIGIKMKEPCKLQGYSIEHFSTLHIPESAAADIEKKLAKDLLQYEKKCQGDHEGIPPVHQTLANLAWKQRHRQDAEKHHARALQLAEKLHGLKSAKLITFLVDAAEFYANSGRLELAAQRLARASNIALDSPSVRVTDSNTLNMIFDLGQIYSQLNQESDAGDLYLRAMQALAQMKQSSDPARATILFGLTARRVAQLIVRAFFHAWMRRKFSVAEIIHRQLKKSPIAQTPEVKTTIERIASQLAVYSDDERFSLMQKHDAAGGRDDVEARLLFDAATNALRNQQQGVAIRLLTEGMHVAERHVRRQRSTAVLTDWLNELRAPLSRIGSLLPQQGEVQPELARLVWTALLTLHARSLEREAQAFKRLHTVQALKENEQQVACEQSAFRELASGRLGSARFETADRACTQALDRQLRDVKAELFDRHPEPFETVAALLSNLAPKGVLVHYIELEPPGALSSSRQRRYLALLLFPDGATRVVPIGAADEIETVITNFLHDVSDPDSSPEVNAQLAYRRILEPVRKAAPNAQEFEIVADGAISLIPFDALYDGKEKEYVLDTALTIRYLTASRDLISPEGSVDDSEIDVRESLVMADPDFKLMPQSAMETSTAVEASTQNLYARMKNLPPLPGAHKEAVAAAGFLATRAHLDGAATEALLRSHQRPGVLLLATHGVFLDDRDGGPGDRSPSLLAIAVPALRITGSLAAPDLGLLGQRIEHPMMRSVLALAGAANADRARDTRQDGILTADEVRKLTNLRGTKLVVLSACETARGSVRAGDGVYGLRRAFRVAGTESLIASLWRVSDAETGKLMTAYFQTLVQDKRPRLTALREVMRDTRERKKHPYYWAPFIGIGIDEPIVVERLFQTK